MSQISAGDHVLGRSFACVARVSTNIRNSLGYEFLVRWISNAIGCVLLLLLSIFSMTSVMKNAQVLMFVFMPRFANGVLTIYGVDWHWLPQCLFDTRVQMQRLLFLWLFCQRGGAGRCCKLNAVRNDVRDIRRPGSSHLLNVIPINTIIGAPQFVFKDLIRRGVDRRQQIFDQS